jgi:hypothetical protein
MSDNPRTLTRQQLSTFIKDPRTLRAFEQVLDQVSNLIPSDVAALSQSIQDASIEASLADGKANQANEAINRIADALELLAYAPRQDSRQTDYIDFPRAKNDPAWQEGRLFYEQSTHSLCYYNDDKNVTLNIGREQLVRIYNNTGSTLLNGKIVYINGASGGFPTAALATASDTSSQSTLGMVTADIANGAFGYVCTSGLVNGLDTSAYGSGVTLYLSATTPGAITTTPPVQPNYVVVIGIATIISATVGAIFIRVDKKNWFPNLEVVLTAASTTLPTTATVIKPDTTIRSEGVSYDSSTGVITINNSQDYNISMLINATPSASNKNIYLYFEENIAGAGWVPKLYSGRQLNLPNATETQVIVSIARYYEVGTQIRFYVWGDATVNLITSNLPGTTAGTVKKPAFRITIA